MISFVFTVVFNLFYIDWDICLYSELVPTLVWVFPQPSTEHPEYGWECSGSSWQEAAAAPGGLWCHLTGEQLQATKEVKMSHIHVLWGSRE